MDLRAEERLRDLRAADERGGRHEDVDAEARDVGLPDRLVDEHSRELRVEPELATDRLAHTSAIERTRERVRDRVRDRPVVLVARVERRHILRLAANDRSHEPLDPLRRDAAEVAVDDRARASAEDAHRLEDRAERGAFARSTLVPARHDRQAVGRRAHAIAGAVLGSAVGVHDQGPHVGEIAAQAFGRCLGHVPDRRRVSKARYPHDDVGAFLSAKGFAHVGGKRGCFSHYWVNYDTET